MDIVFLSNYYNHHQKPLCRELSRIPDVSFTFVETKPMPDERRKLGYENLEDPFVLRAYEADREEECQRRVLDADVVIAGSCPEKMLRERIRAGKLIFRYSERPLKNGLELQKYPLRFLRYHAQNPPGRPIYLLCASAFASWDYGRFGLFCGRAFKWGYFPECRVYSPLEAPENRKIPGRILWCGRLLALKHPEHAVLAAERLRDTGYHFSLDFIGTGPEQDKMAMMIHEKNLADRVRLLGAMRPEQVRKYMEQAEIFLFNSDGREGWGAVLNEAMNSGCAIVASHVIGSVPFLVRNGQNGMVYSSGDWQQLADRVSLLLDDTTLRREMGRAAYRTIVETWNAKTAAERFVVLCRQILSGEDGSTLFADGPCSAAPPLRDHWFLNLSEDSE